MDSLYGATRWHESGWGDDEWPEGRPSKRLRASKGHASILQPVAQLVRSPLYTLSSIAQSLGLVAESAREQLHLSLAEEDRQLQRLRLQTATTVEEWRAAASELDRLENGNKWKDVDEDEECDYDPKLIKMRLQLLQDASERGDVEDMRFQIRTALTRDLGGMGDMRLYRRSHIGTKTLIERYIDTVTDAIDTVVETSGLEPRIVWDMMKSSRQAFGRSALLLSGGGTLGMNHIGVVKALYEAQLLPRIISGASAGSIVCAVLCTKTDEEMPEVLRDFCSGELDVFEKADAPSTLTRTVKRLFTKGVIYDVENLKRVMRNLLGDMTFLEAYNRTQRILSICVSSAKAFEMPRLLNYITAPDVVIWSAVTASCSVPLVFASADIYAKNRGSGELLLWDEEGAGWIDGSVENDLPMTRLAEMLNVNHFIVSQVNPHVVPFLSKEEDELDLDAVRSNREFDPGPSWMSTMANLAKGEALHRLHVMAELGVWPTMTTKLRSIVGQRYSGDITILPEISYTQFPSILSNPTPDFMEQALMNGQRATWPKLSRIRNHLAIELKLDEAVRKMTRKTAFSSSQVDLRINQFQRSPKSTRPTRGRSRHGSRGSHQSARSTIVPRQEPGRQSVHRPIKSMFDPPTISPHLSLHKTQGPTASEDYFSSADESVSPRSTSPTPQSDADDDAVYPDSESPPPSSPAIRQETWPSTRRTFVSVSQPATPSAATKSFAATASHSPASTRTPLAAAASLTMTPTAERRPSSPEMRYQKLFHRGKVSPMPTMKSQAATPEPREPSPRLSRKFSKLGLTIDLSGTKGMVRRQKRSWSSGLSGWKSPERQ